MTNNLLLHRLVMPPKLKVDSEPAVSLLESIISTVSRKKKSRDILFNEFDSPCVSLPLDQSLIGFDDEFTTLNLKVEDFRTDFCFAQDSKGFYSFFYTGTLLLFYSDIRYKPKVINSRVYSIDKSSHSIVYSESVSNSLNKLASFMYSTDYAKKFLRS